MTNSTNPSNSLSTEERILRKMKKVLTRIIKETAKPPGEQHPLSDACINDMRECLFLVSSREQQLARDDGRLMHQRPRYADESPAQSTVVITLDQIKGKGNGSA